MKLTKNHKIIIGVLGVTVLAYITRKYWMPKKKETSTNPTGNVSTQSAPTTNPASTKLSREEMLNKLTNPTGGKVEGGSMSIEMPKEVFATLTDKELEFMLMMGEMDKELKKDLPVSKSKEDFLKQEEYKKKQGEEMMLKKGYKKSDVENIMNTITKKMQEQIMFLESKMKNK